MALLIPSAPPLIQERPPLSVVRGASTSGRGDIDLGLLGRAQTNDPTALEAFVRFYQDRVFAFLLRSGSGADAEDLTQEVFLRALRALPRFVSGRAKVSTWLFQIAVRLLQDQGRRNKMNHEALGEDLRDQAPNPEELCRGEHLAVRIETLVASLPEEQRTALLLSQFHALRLEEISEATGVPIATVKTRIFRAKSALKAALGGER